MAGQGKTKGMVATIESPMTGNQSLAAVVSSKEVINYIFLSYYIESKYKKYSRTCRRIKGWFKSYAYKINSNSNFPINRTT